MAKKQAKRAGVFSTEEIKTIRSELRRHFPDGMLRAKEVVEVAKNPRNPLHKFFEWNDTRAARLYRLRQANKLIQCVTVTVENTEVRAYHSVKISSSAPRVFMSTEQVMNAPDIYEQVLERAMNEALSWKRRFENLRQLSPIVKAIEGVNNGRRSTHAKTEENQPRN